RMPRTAGIHECPVSVARQRTPRVDSPIAKARPIEVVGSAIAVVDEEIDQAHGQEVTLVHSMCATRRDVLEEFFRPLDGARSCESRLAVWHLASLQLDGAEHANDRISDRLEARAVSHDEQLG